VLDHLATRETVFVLASRARYDKIAAVAKERGWSVRGTPPTAATSTTTTRFPGRLPRQLQYNYRPEPDLLGGAQSTEMPGVSCFLRDGEEIFHTYSTYARGTDAIVGAYSWLDMTASAARKTGKSPRPGGPGPRRRPDVHQLTSRHAIPLASGMACSIPL